MNLANYYDKPETNNLLGNKLDTSTYNTGIALKADISNVYYKFDLYTQNQ